MHCELGFCASVGGGGGPTWLKMFYVPRGKVEIQNRREWITKLPFLGVRIGMSSNAITVVVDSGPCHCLPSMCQKPRNTALWHIKENGPIRKQRCSKWKITWERHCAHNISQQNSNGDSSTWNCARHWSKWTQRHLIFASMAMLHFDYSWIWNCISLFGSFSVLLESWNSGWSHRRNWKAGRATTA